MNRLQKHSPEVYFKRQNKALRDPAEILSGSYETNGLSPNSLQVKTTESFIELLERLKITLFVTREYEHLVLALAVKNGALLQSFIHLPHPSGLVVNRVSRSLFVATTRNPNQIWELKPATNYLRRGDRLADLNFRSYLLPTRVKYLPGAYYLHDLAILKGRLYGTSVGQNAVVRLDFDKDHSDKIVWWPKCIEDERQKPNHTANFIQFNSIAAGRTLEESFFSASSSKISRMRPGHLNYSIDRKGVIFSGKTREVCATGLTRPHSARFFENQIWVDNSGYGEVGYVENGRFKPYMRLPGWTRGLAFVNRIMFVGVSRVLPKFHVYAPGLDAEKENQCGLYAIDLDKGTIIGSVTWPYGNQIFALDWMRTSMTEGFPFIRLRKSSKKILSVFYSSLV
jgi:uncharacterized protein (TIGR03032 family)